MFCRKLYLYLERDGSENCTLQDGEVECSTYSALIISCSGKGVKEEDLNSINPVG